MPEYMVDVRRILEEIGGSVHAEDILDLDVLQVGEERFDLLEPARFDIYISNAGEALVKERDLIKKGKSRGKGRAKKA